MNHYTLIPRGKNANHYTTDTTLEARMLIITHHTRGKNANHYTTDTTLEARILIITLLIPHSRQEC